MRSKRRILALLPLVAGLLCGARAAEADVSPVKQALVVMRVLAYDHALRDRAAERVEIAVVHGSSSESLACASRLREAFDTLAPRVKVAGLSIAVHTLAADSVTPARLTQRRISVAYLCRGTESELSSVFSSTRRAGVLSFSDQVGYLKGGLAVALVAGPSRIHLSINLEAARAEGARLDSQLLRLSKVVKR